MTRNNRSRSVRWLLLAAALGLCLAQSGALNGDGAARVLTLTGQVSVLRDAQPWALHEGSAIQPKQVVITGADGYAVFQVSDGSTFEVFPNSKVVFRNNSDWKDMLDMMIGRIKVHVQKRLGGLPNPNNVRTPTAVISVRGTVFDVEVEDAEATTLVSVEEGQVAVQHLLHPSNEPKLLNTGEWLRVYKNQPLARRQVDRGSVIKAALRAAADALYATVYRSPRGPSGPGGVPGGGTVGGGGGIPGDHGPTQTPPPPPPPPDAPPAP